MSQKASKRIGKKVQDQILNHLQISLKSLNSRHAQALYALRTAEKNLKDLKSERAELNRAIGLLKK